MGIKKSLKSHEERMLTHIGKCKSDKIEKKKERHEYTNTIYREQLRQLINLIRKNGTCKVSLDKYNMYMFINMICVLINLKLMPM
jgi:hypothetical protein